jgi:hypothetical protein
MFHQGIGIHQETSAGQLLDYQGIQSPERTQTMTEKILLGILKFTSLPKNH